MTRTEHFAHSTTAKLDDAVGLVQSMLYDGGVIFDDPVSITNELEEALLQMESLSMQLRGAL